MHKLIINSVQNAEIVKRPYGLLRILAARNSRKAISKKADLLLLEIEPGKKTSKHYHIKSEEIFYVVQGKAIIIGKGTTIEVRKKDVILVPPTEIHCIKNIGDVPCIILMVESPPYDETDKFYVDESNNTKKQ